LTRIASFVAVLVLGAALPGAAQEDTGAERAIRAGLDWLQRTQEPDGSWDAIDRNPWHGEFGLPGFCGLADSGIDPAVTALAYLALLETGGAAPDSPHAAVATRALGYLHDTGSDYVKFAGPPKSECICHGGHSISRMYDPPLVFLALLRACEARPAEDLRKLGKDGLELLFSKRDEPTGTCRYLPRQDSGVSIFVLEAIFTARRAGIPVPAGLAEEAGAYWKLLIEPATGRVRHEDTNPQCLGGWDAIAISLSFQRAFDAADSETARRQIDLLLGHAPKWDAVWELPARKDGPPTELIRLDRDVVNFFYWYHGTRALKPAGGETWRRWRESLTSALVGAQVTEGEDRGSWDPADPWGRIGGRVYSTAYAVRALAEAR